MIRTHRVMYITMVLYLSAVMLLTLVNLGISQKIRCFNLSAKVNSKIFVTVVIKCTQEPVSELSPEEFLCMLADYGATPENAKWVLSPLAVQGEAKKFMTEAAEACSGSAEGIPWAACMKEQLYPKCNDIQNFRQQN